MWSRLRGLLVAAVCLFPTAPAQATVVTGYLEGLVYGVWHSYRPDNVLTGSFRSDNGRLYFACETSLAPAPTGPNCPEIFCAYDSWEPSPDEVNWLPAAFDFGEFKGVSVPGTAIDQWFYIENDSKDVPPSYADSFGVGLTADWLATLGAGTDNVSGRMWGPASMFNCTNLLQSANSSGVGKVYRQKFTGRFLDTEFGFLAEFEFDPNYLRMVIVPEPSTLALMAIGLVVVGFAGRRKLAA